MNVKQVVKRDGSLQPYDPAKIMRWQMWAAKGIESYIDWQGVLVKVTKDLYDGISTTSIQQMLIDECATRTSSSYDLLAGRLYCSLIRKKVFGGDKIPTVLELHAKLTDLGLMKNLDFTADEYAQVEKIIDHRRDFNLVYGQAKQLHLKYALSNKVQKLVYETPQFTFMRMAMTLAQDSSNKLEAVKSYYDMFSTFKGSAPTPNYNNLGTPHRGFVSCCLYTCDDDVRSIGIAEHIAYTMTYMSAGIGGFMNIRSIGDSVKNGTIVHQGKLPYFRGVGTTVNENRQGARGGASTQYVGIFDPEIIDIIYLQNPRTPIKRQNRDLHFAILYNDFFVSKVHKREQVFLFNVKTAPDLMREFFASDSREFARLYEQYENNPDFKKTYVDAMDLMLQMLNQSHEVATLYSANITEINRHTPFDETIYSSNLCAEIVQPTKPYRSMKDLYTPDDHEDKGEVSLCGLGGIIPARIENDAQYEQVAYNELKMIDYCITNNQYEFPHLKTTALSRMNAGVGIVGLAYELARNKLRYDTPEGWQHMHRIAERHAYYLIKASLRLSKERGKPAYMHRTKWAKGWLPIDTYNKNVDTIADFKLHYDWEALRQEIIDNGGIGHSALIAHMPTESSSKAAHMPNQLYPIRQLFVLKTDDSNSIDFLAPDCDTIGQNYQLAYDVPLDAMIKTYAIFQKWADQAISADFYIDRVKEPVLKASRLIDEFMLANMYGLKTRYYTNSKTTKGHSLLTLSTGLSQDLPDEQERQYQKEVLEEMQGDDSVGCEGGFCTL